MSSEIKRHVSALRRLLDELERAVAETAEETPKRRSDLEVAARLAEALGGHLELLCVDGGAWVAYATGEVVGHFAVSPEVAVGSLAAAAERAVVQRVSELRARGEDTSSLDAILDELYGVRAA